MYSQNYLLFTEVQHWIILNGKIIK
uniref:Uncharacterized protein n=1 Tax=Rhizophora mucronata TaxID=61149 RepID=A0A2P2NAD3_RHIMU